MKYLITAEEARKIDRGSSESGMPSLVLMERAALAVRDAALEILHEASSSGKQEVLVISGTGNNGADGAAICRMLRKEGIRVRLLVVGAPDHFRPDLRAQLTILENDPPADGAPYEVLDPGQYGENSPESVRPGFSSPDLIIDALFGTGLAREIQGGRAALIGKINEAHERGTKVLAVDIPSGIHSDSGKILGCAVHADETVTFGFEKRGHVLFPGTVFCGTVRTAEIGFLNRVQKQILSGEQTLMAAEPPDLRGLPKREPDGNKGTFGKVLIAAGSLSVCGAAILSSKAALSSGCGMVKVLTEDHNRIPLACAFPEALIDTYSHDGLLRSLTDSEDGRTSGALVNVQENLKQDAEWADVILAGPGLGTDAVSKWLLRELLRISQELNKELVLDADALNLIAADPDLLQLVQGSCTITPHMAEMSRLTGKSIPELKADPVQSAREYAREHNVCCILKDARTVTAFPSGCAYLNDSGCDAMATAGSGDVLAGILAGVLARKVRCGAGEDKDNPPVQVLAVLAHGLAGENAAAGRSASSVTAGDLICYLDQVIS